MACSMFWLLGSMPIYSKECGFLVELTGGGSAVVCKK